MPRSMLSSAIWLAAFAELVLAFRGSFIVRKDNRRPSLSSLLVAKKKVVVIGGGWAGFSAADALATAKEAGGNESAVEVEVLDASSRGPGGLAAGWRTPVLQRPVEAGIHGFWREYRNTFAAIERIGLDLDDVLTDYTPSILVSESGRVALAPVLGKDSEEEDGIDSQPGGFSGLDLLQDPAALLTKVAPLLPPPLDVALLSEFNPANPLDLVDRLSALGLLGAWADFEQESRKSWERYDKISADNLFRISGGATSNLYRELISPLLHVLPMTPGYDCSAAAALSCFHVFALQSRGAFDVRWCRGSITERIFNPWAEKLQSGGNVTFRGGSKVTSIEGIGEENGPSRFKVTVNGEVSIDCDAIVLAVGGTAMKRLLPSSPVLSGLPDAIGWKQFRGVTCVAVRFFFKPNISQDGKPMMISSIANAMQDSPVVVCGPRIGGIPELVESGFCIYDLQRLQDEFKEIEGDPPVVALEVDFFRANALASIEDNKRVAEIALQGVSEALDIDKIAPELILDVSVVRARDSVSHFCVNSLSSSSDIKLQQGLYMCGDWIDRAGHASWSTEKSVVTARQAASAMAEDFGLDCDADVIPAVSDTPQLSSLRNVARLVRKLTPGDAIPPAPWVVAKHIFSRGS